MANNPKDLPGILRNYADIHEGEGQYVEAKCLRESADCIEQAKVIIQEMAACLNEAKVMMEAVRDGLHNDIQ